MYKIDLHTHSEASRDGSITTTQYHQVLEDGTLDYVAITDHNKIDFALELQKTLGNKVIVGEEINTKEGEVIGLFLTEKISRDMTVKETIRAIKKQNGIVYVPHPFETVRKGLPRKVIESIIDDIDVMEVFNGRAFFQNKGPEAATLARINNIPGMASSDAHGAKGLGTAYGVIHKPPTANNLADQLSTAKLIMKRPPLKTLLYPKANRIKKGWARD